MTEKAKITHSPKNQDAQPAQYAYLQSFASAINATQAIVEFHLDGKVSRANENYLNKLGYTQNEIEGQSYSFFLSGSKDTSELAEIWEELKTGKTHSGEF